MKHNRLLLVSIASMTMLLSSCGGIAASSSMTSSLDETSSQASPDSQNEEGNSSEEKPSSSKEEASSNVSLPEIESQEGSKEAKSSETEPVESESSVSESSKEVVGPSLPEGYKVPEGVSDIFLQEGARLDCDEKVEGVSLEIDSSTGKVYLKDVDGNSLITAVNEEHGAGYLPMDYDYVVSKNGDDYELVNGKLTITQKGDLIEVSYGHGTVPYFYLFSAKEEAIQTGIRYNSTAIDLHYGMQRLVEIKGKGFAYVHNQLRAYGLSLYEEGNEEKVLALTKIDGVYEVKNEEITLFVKYVGEDIFVRSSFERGTYTCEGQTDLVLDGFRNYTWGEIKGEYDYQNDGKSVYLRDPDEPDNVDKRTLIFINMETYTYEKYVPPVVDLPSPIAKGSYYEGSNVYTTQGGITLIFKFTLSFSSFTDNRVSEYIYANMGLSDIYAQKKINTGAWDYTYDGQNIHMTSTSATYSGQEWVWKVSSDTGTLTLVDSPLGIEDIPNVTIVGTKQISYDD